MQNSSCAWYLPWTLAAQQQKLMAMAQSPYADKMATVTTPGNVYAPHAAHAGTVPHAHAHAQPHHHHHQQHHLSAAQVQSDLQQQQQQAQIVPPTQQQQLHQHSPNTAAPPPANYQQPSLHPSAGTHFPMAAYNFPQPLLNAAQLQHSQQQQQQQHQQQQQQQLAASYNSQLGLHAQTQHLLHSSMFPPLSLGPYLTAGPGTSHAASAFSGVTAQALLAVAAGSSLPPQATASTVNGLPQRATSAAMVQPLNCVPAVAYSQELQHQQLPPAINLNLGVMALRNHNAAATAALSSIKALPAANALPSSLKLSTNGELEKQKLKLPEKRKTDDNEQIKDLKKAKLETKALKAKRPGFTDERYQETSYYTENGLRKVYPYYFTFTTFTKGRWVGEKILDIFAREFRAHPAEEYERCIQTGTLTVNFEKVPVDYRLKHNDLLANIVHRHEVPVTCQPITIVHMDEDIVVVNKPASIPVHPCGRYRHNTVVFILAKEFQLKNLRTIHRLDRLTSGLLLFGRSPKKARQMEQQIRNRQVEKEYICRVEGVFPDGVIECKEPIEVVSYKIGVCKVSPKGKECTTTFQKVSENGKTSVVLCKPLTGRMHQIRVHLQFLGFPILNDPLYNHEVFGPLKGRCGDIGGKTDDELIKDLITIHNAENWLGIDCDSDISLFKTTKDETDRESLSSDQTSGVHHSDDDVGANSRETTPPCVESPKSVEVVKQLETPSNEPAWSQTTCSNLVEATTLQSSSSAEIAVDKGFTAEKLTTDKHCYECKVHYRDPKPKDLVMYLHALKYKGPGWEYKTELPTWACTDWEESAST